MSEMIAAVPLWQWLAIIGIGCAIAEMFAPGFVMLPIGVGFFVAAALASFIVSPVMVALVLAASLFVSWLVFAKIFKPKVGMSVYASNADRLIGQKFMLLERIDAGQVGKIKAAGDVFYALSATGVSIEAGREVIVQRFEGNRAVVADITTHS